MSEHPLDFSYEIHGRTGDGKPERRHVFGYQVGLFAVRFAGKHTAHDSAGAQRDAWPWMVDHWPSGYGIRDAPTFADAVVIADDVSRFADELGQDSNLEPTETNIKEVIRKLGGLILGWLQYMKNTRTVVSYRKWRLGVELLDDPGDF